MVDSMIHSRKPCQVYFTYKDDSCLTYHDYMWLSTLMFTSGFLHIAMDIQPIADGVERPVLVHRLAL